MKTSDHRSAMPKDGSDPRTHPNGARRAFVARGMLLAAALGPLSLAARANGDAFPNRPIRVVLGSPFGSGVDFVMRLLANGMQADLGQPIVIDARPGADGVIAAQLVAKSPGDGYTIMASTHTQLVANPVARAKLAYDVERDFVPLSLLTDHHVVVAVHPSVPVRSLRELRDYSRARADGLIVGASSITFRLVTEAVAYATGADLRHIPYNGMTPAFNAVVAGHVEVAALDASVALDAIRGGRLRALAIGASKRLAILPDVPTFSEAGYPVLDEPLWVAMVAPAGLPEPVAERLRAAIHRALASPDVRDRLVAMAITPRPSSGKEMAESIRAQQAAFAREMKRLGITPQ